jgi:hypothetical protein
MRPGRIGNARSVWMEFGRLPGSGGNPSSATKSGISIDLPRIVRNES